MKISFSIILAFILASFASGITHAQKPVKSANAIRVNPVPPEIDGVLDDEIGTSQINLKTKTTFGPIMKSQGLKYSPRPTER